MAVYEVGEAVDGATVTAAQKSVARDKLNAILDYLSWEAPGGPGTPPPRSLAELEEWYANLDARKTVAGILRKHFPSVGVVAERELEPPTKGEVESGRPEEEEPQDDCR
jgi:hypothetical protein